MRLHTFSLSTPDVTFLILQNFSSHKTPSPPTADVAVLILHTLSSHSTKLSSYCRCDYPGSAHFLSSYCRCDILDTADFLLTLHTLSSYCRCSSSDTAHSHPQTAQPSSPTADATLLVLHTFYPGTVNVTFLILQTFSSHHTPFPPTEGVALLTLYTLSSHSTTFSLYCRCDPPGTAHFLSSYC